MSGKNRQNMKRKFASVIAIIVIAAMVLSLAAPFFAPM